MVARSSSYLSHCVEIGEGQWDSSSELSGLRVVCIGYGGVSALGPASEKVQAGLTSYSYRHSKLANGSAASVQSAQRPNLFVAGLRLANIQSLTPKPRWNHSASQALGQVVYW